MMDDTSSASSVPGLSLYNRATYNNFTNYQMSAELHGSGFEKYVDTIVPTTRQLIDTVSDDASGKMCFHDFVSLLEPYSVYSNDLTYPDYSTVQSLVDRNISQFVNVKQNGLKMYSRMKTMPHSNQFSSTSLTSMASEVLNTILMDKYNKMGLNYSSSEMLSKMIHLDYGRLLTDMMSRSSVLILVHANIDKMMDTLRDTGSEGESSGKKGTKTSREENDSSPTCSLIVMAKQYFSQDEMERDNKTMIFFDNRYDDTNYSMLVKPKEPFTNTVEKFDAERTQMTAEDFHAFIHKKVRGVRSNTVSDSEIDHLTDTLIAGKRRVRDGDYALLQSDGEPSYFKRVGDVWKLDEAMNDRLVTDNTALNCNLEPGCVYVDDNAGQQCSPASDVKKSLHANILKEIVGRFDERYAITMDELLDYLIARIERSDYLLDLLKARRVREICKYDLQQYTIGAELASSGILSSEMDAVSPHMDLKQRILAQKDLGKKYSDLLYFITHYTEECIDGGDGGENAERWRYCKTTKKRFLPVFMHELAVAWAEDGGDYDRVSYRSTLQRLIREIGAESDDGASWVDKYSGEVIVKKDFDTEEGYGDNGRKSVSRSIGEEDLETRYMNDMRKAHATVVKYSTPETKIMYRVVTALAGFMSISLSTQTEFIIKIASATLMTPGVLPSEADHQRASAAKATEGKKTRTYENVYHETIMYLTLAAVLIGIQTSVPSVATKKTFPGCIRSFSGYPFEGDGDTTGLAYLACVARKGTASSGVWSVLRRKSPENIMQMIKKFTDTYYLTNLDVKAKIQEKIDYLITNPDDTMPAENRVEHWTTFLPPLTVVRQPRLEPVVSGYRDLLISDIKMGSMDQWAKLNVLQGKIVQFALSVQVGVQQIINEVKGHRAGGDELFIDEFGAGVSEKQSMGTTQLQYFSHLNGDIPRNEIIVRSLEGVVSDVNRLSKALQIFCGINDKVPRAPLRNDYSEETIYRAFISICRFNRQTILDPDLLAICSGKPDNFSASDTISEKIRKLKDDGKVYDGPYLEKLLRTNGLKHRVDVQYDAEVITQVQHLRNVMEQCRAKDTFSNTGSDLGELMRHLDIVLDTFNYDTYKSSPTVRALRNFLSGRSDRMRTQITEFISDHVSMSPSQTKSMNTFLRNLSSWEEDEGGDTKAGHMQSSPYYNLFAFINTYIRNLTTVFPDMIQHKVDHQTTLTYATAKRLSLSRNAVDAINSNVLSDYHALETFYTEPSIDNVLTSIQNKCDTIRQMAEHTPYFTEIPTNGATIVSVLDKTTCRMLFEYYMLATMHSYVELAQDEKMLNIDGGETEYSADDLRRRADSGLPSIDPGVYMSDMKKMQSTTARLLFQYVRVMQNHKDAVQPAYLSIMDTNFKIREGEKERITWKLEHMTDEERDLDNIMKINKQGVWGKGLQKGLTMHVIESYDDEREFADKMQEIERDIRSTKSGVVDENLEQFKDDYLADLDREVDEGEEFNISRFRGDDADGDPYGEENDDEDE
jgi:hypothetical protein